MNTMLSYNVVLLYAFNLLYKSAIISTEYAKKVSLIIFAITLSTVSTQPILNFRNFWHIHTIGNWQPEDI